MMEKMPRAWNNDLFQQHQREMLNAMQSKTEARLLSIVKRQSSHHRWSIIELILCEAIRKGWWETAIILFCKREWRWPATMHFDALKPVFGHIEDWTSISRGMDEFCRRATLDIWIRVAKQYNGAWLAYKIANMVGIAEDAHVYHLLENELITCKFAKDQVVIRAFTSGRIELAFRLAALTKKTKLMATSHVPNWVWLIKNRFTYIGFTWVLCMHGPATIKRVIKAKNKLLFAPESRWHSEEIRAIVRDYGVFPDTYDDTITRTGYEFDANVDLVKGQVSVLFTRALLTSDKAAKAHILSFGTDPTSALRIALLHNRRSLAMWIWESYKQGIDLKCLIHWAILSRSCKACRIVASLSEIKVDESNGSGLPPIVLAVWTCKRSIIRFVLSLGPDLGLKDQSGFTALDYAEYDAGIRRMFVKRCHLEGIR